MSNQPPTLRPWSQRPFTDGENVSLNQFHDWIITSLNALIGQNVPSAPGFGSLQNPVINPASKQLASQGSRTNSISTAITWTSTTTSISFYWDGTNGSKPLTIYRDDNTVISPVVGSLVVSGLTPNTLYFFYPFFQDFSEIANSANITAEPLGTVVFASVPGAKPVGSPPVAYTAQNPLCTQRQYLLDHIPLALSLSTTGITTPNAGTGSGSGGSGGGGAGGGNGRFDV